MGFVEVKLLNYNFKFQRLQWTEEFRLRFPPEEDPIRVLLGHALVEVSGLKVPNFETAMKVLKALPTAITTRVFKIYKGSQGLSRRFRTGSLYRAPAPRLYRQIFDDQEAQEERAAEATMARIKRQFGQEELDTQQTIEKKILEKARNKDGGYKGAVAASEDYPGENRS